mgnify:CR=1 FL=1
MVRTLRKLALAALTGACLGGLLWTWLAPPWVEPPGEPLGPWGPELDLRASFESLPRVRGRAPRLQLLDENQDAWVARWRLLASARHRIDMASFIVRRDEYGLAFLGHLLARARDGVRVRVLVDAQGTHMARSFLDEDYLDELVAAGVEARVYRPLPERFLQALIELDPASAVASEHDKLLLVDGRWGLIGGRNVAKEYFADPASHPQAFLDADLLVEGPAAVRALTQAFEVEWTSPSTEPIAREKLDLVPSEAELLEAYRAMDAWLRGEDPGQGEVARALRERHPGLQGALQAPPPPRARGEVRVLDSSARRLRMDDPVTEGLRRLLVAAERRVLIVSPYLVLTPEAIEELSRAAGRGVEITVLTNSPTSSDNALSQAYFAEQWPTLLARVPGLRLFVRGDDHNLHAKTATFDGQVAVVATYNLDPLSMAINGEIAVVAWSPELAASIERSAGAMLQAGPPTVYEYRILRDEEGEPVLDEEGQPQVLFGPQDHTDRSRWSGMDAWWSAIRAARQLGLDPVAH